MKYYSHPSRLWWISGLPGAVTAALEPALEEFAQDTPDLKIGKVNVDEEPELAKQFRIMTIPTVLLIQNGKIIDKKIAPSDPEDLEEMLDAL